MSERKQNDEVRRLAGEIYEERYMYLLRIARRNAATRSDAEEALQEAFAYSSQAMTRLPARRRWPGSR